MTSTWALTGASSSRAALDHCSSSAVTLLLLAVWLSASVASAVEPSSSEFARTAAWVERFLLSEHEFAYNFRYEGDHVRGRLASWKTSHQTGPADRQFSSFIRRHTDPATGLEVRCEITQYHDYPAVEWVLRLTNTSDSDTPLLENVMPLSFAAENPTDGGSYRLRYANGSHERSDDFRMFETSLSAPNELCTFSSFAGRSSDGHLPFFNLVMGNDSAAAGGLMIGVGWTGQWRAAFRYLPDGNILVRAGMEKTRFKLLPGESVRTPASLLVFWDGDDPHRGHNLLRAVVREHFSPRIEGKLVSPPAAVSVHGSHGFHETTEANVLATIERIAQADVGADTFWIDTGWFELINNNWAASTGNFEPDPVRFPNGLGPIGAAAHKHNMRFLLWFEPERVMPGTWLHKNHPGWLIPPPPTLAYDLTYMHHDGFHLLDLGNEEVAEWLTQKTLSMIEEMNIDTYRQDGNIYPLDYWRYGEPDDRQGIREIRYITALYKYWDVLLAAHPGLTIDNCASGGRRIDFEALRRSFVLWRSDTGKRTDEPDQCMTYALSHWVPLHGTGTRGTTDYQVRSRYSSAFVCSPNREWSDQQWADFASRFDEYLSLKQLYEGDFYPLTEYSLSKDALLAYQYDRPDLGKGLVQIFRRVDCPQSSTTLRLRGLEHETEYTWHSLDDADQDFRASGRQLEANGIDISLPKPPACVIIVYERTGG